MGRRYKRYKKTEMEEARVTRARVKSGGIMPVQWRWCVSPIRYCG